MTGPMVTVVIPTIPPRVDVLREALASVRDQTYKNVAPLVVVDGEHAGAPATRHRGLMQVRTPWVAFLDDDDILTPQHIEKLLAHAMDTKAHYVYSWYWTIPNGADPFPETHFTDPWDPDVPRQTTVTTMVDTHLAQEVGFLGDRGTPTGDGMRAGEDWDFTLGCNRLGTISHLVERTWYWRHWGQGSPDRQGNTSGRGDRW